MNNVQSPCKDCGLPKRTPVCHGSCREYKEWQEGRIERSRHIIKEKSKESVTDNYVVAVIRKYRKYKGG